MKRIFQKFLTLALVALVIPSCGNPTKMAEQADKVSVQCEPTVLEVVADKIAAKVTVNFPNEFFHPKAIVEAVPVLVYNGGEVALDPVMLQGEEVTNNYKTVAKAGGSITENFTFDYKEGMEQSHLEIRMTVIYKDKKVPFAAPYKVADGANTTYKMVKTHGALAYAPDAYQAVIPEKGEAQILYLINSSTVRPAQLKTNEIKAFEEFLATVNADERRTVKETEIIAYASPDGKEDFNAKLSVKRAETANKAFSKTINKKAGVKSPVNSTSVSEDWEGFKELVQNSDIADKDLILRVLEMYSDPAVREREIKNMSQVYTTLAKEILPQLRRARFIANIEFANYTDAELVEFVNSNIEILDEEALLHAATLVKDDAAKATIYAKAADKFASDRANVNLAVVYLNMSKEADAAAVIAKVSNKDAYYYNTVGVIALRKGNNSEAVAALSKSSLKEAQYNLAVVDILNGKYSDAASKLSGQGCFNEALAALLVNQPAKTIKIAGNKTCPWMNYLKAVAFARQGDVAAAKEALEVAKKDTDLAKRMLTDVEFAKIK